MRDTAGPVRVIAAHRAEEVQAAAAIWARATSHRDNDPEPATAEEAMPRIRQRLSVDGAILLLALREGGPVGFAIVAPQAQALEIFYLGVDPDAWGTGVGGLLLRSVEDHARAVGLKRLELWAIHDNVRAIRLYEGSGWTRTTEAQRTTPAGRPESQFAKQIG